MEKVRERRKSVSQVSAYKKTCSFINLEYSQLTIQGTILFEKLIITQLVERINVFQATRRFIPIFTKAKSIKQIMKNKRKTLSTDNSQTK
jgi:hypothetical protein